MLSMNGQDYEFGCSCLTKKRSIDESFVSICTNYNKYAKYIFPQTFSLRNKIVFNFIGRFLKYVYYSLVAATPIRASSTLEEEEEVDPLFLIQVF